MTNSSEEVAPAAAPDSSVAAPMPKAENLTSAQRLAMIDFYKEQQSKGVELNIDELRHVISLLRCERAANVRERSKSKTAERTQIAEPSIEDLMG